MSFEFAAVALEPIKEVAKEAGEVSVNGMEGMDVGALKETPIIDLQTIRSDLAGKEHPETGIPYKEITIELENGEIFKGVFPEFPNIFEVTLDESQYFDSDGRQFRCANNELNAAIMGNPDLAAKFTPEQLEKIELGRTPDGYVWHHSETPGVLQLVDKELHELSRHTGGRSIWGGGQEFR